MQTKAQNRWIVGEISRFNWMAGKLLPSTTKYLEDLRVTGISSTYLTARVEVFDGSRHVLSYFPGNNHTKAAFNLLVVKLTVNSAMVWYTKTECEFAFT